MLPFTREAFLDVFAAYNQALWPMAVLAWLLAALTVAVAVRAPERRGLVSGLLAVQWGWAGVAYHAVFFTAINPAAWVFAGLFVAEAVLLTRYGSIAKRFRGSDRRSPSAVLGWALMAYSLLYPLIAVADGNVFPRTPTFGVPCPTAILTIGALLAVDRPLPAALAVIPILWALVGGSAAFLLDMRVDLMMPIAAVILIADLVIRRPRAAHGPAVRLLP